MGNGLLKMASLGVKKASEVGLDKAKSGVKHCLETKKLLEENQCRWQAASEKYQREVSRLSLIIEKTQSLIGLCKRYGLTDGEIPYPIVHSLEKEFPDCKLQQDGSFLFKGAAAGAFAAASTLGGTAVLGTASTGTAIASLHGAAAAGAALASLGGGSLAAGGLGIAGGVAALGTTFAVPAIATGGYLWDKSVRKQHQKVLAYEKAVEEECRILQQIYRRYDALNTKLITWLAGEQYSRRIKGSAE